MQLAAANINQVKMCGIVATSHDGIVTLSGLHFLPFGVRTATGAAPCKAHDAHLLNRVMTFYKWSSENRFFSTKPSAWSKKRELWAILVNC